MNITVYVRLDKARDIKEKIHESQQNWCVGLLERPSEGEHNKYAQLTIPLVHVVYGDNTTDWVRVPLYILENVV